MESGWWDWIGGNEGIPRKKGRWVVVVDEMDGTRGENLGLSTNGLGMDYIYGKKESLDHSITIERLRENRL